DAEFDMLADPGYRAELARWAGGERDQDGIPSSAAGPRDPRGHTPARDFLRSAAAGHEGFGDSPPPARPSPPGRPREHVLRAGQALQRVLLTVTLRGIAASPLTQPLETRDAWLVREPGAGSGWPQLILRIGYGLPVPASPRRPVRDVLEEPPPGKY